MSDIVDLWREIDAIKRILDRMPNEDGTGGGSGFISGSGTAGRVMQWASPSSATDANLIGPASNLLTMDATVPATLTVGATSLINGSLVGNMTGAGTIATGGFTGTLPATGTFALGTGTASYVPRWSDANTIGNSTIRDDATTAAIGVAPVANQLLTISAATETNNPLVLISTDYSATKNVFETRYTTYITGAITSQGQFAVGNILGSSGPVSYIGARIQNRSNAANVYGADILGQLTTSTAGRSAYGIQVTAGTYDTTVNVQNIFGIQSISASATTGAVTQMTAHYNIIQQTAAGTIASAYGNVSYIASNSGTISIYTALRLGGTAGGDLVVGTITNAYGLYVNSVSGAATLNYAIYTNAGLNRFGDQVDVIGSADRVQLRATGYTTQSSPVAHFIDNQTTANAVREVLRLEARVSTAATGSSAGFGPALDFYAESATDTNYRQMGRIETVWYTATDASRSTTVNHYAYDSGGARKWISATADGTGPVVSLLGALNLVVVTKTTTYTAAYEHVINCDTSGAAWTLGLPSVSGQSGRWYMVKKIDNSANALTIDAAGSELIDGSLTAVLANFNDAVILVSDGTGWKIY